ncbi:sodium/hydrogen exchanger 2-like isoform X4 [Ischnura elegans]|uniref:sodium/hydrogen exchanger 2-like isoform X4 n=1 Tax=Ischnura elegans TaxID=197161 RepID=UPI001ED87E76|nr:sodium/hydrogen exchanger 2-like isoform X4 [Ischnura elegans]XP_046400756.1 sodium/hydrogen exchanger 2-like isoform X4 [Ischnura elegans]
MPADYCWHLRWIYHLCSASSRRCYRCFANIHTNIIFLRSSATGTIFNTFAIGLLLYGLDSIDWMGNWCPKAFEQDDLFTKITLVELLIFSALISAVDPVAVLAIFQEVGVNKDLYFLIFGESLLNDAITVVLYSTMVSISGKPSVGGLDFTMAVLSFFTVNFGGVTVGIIFGLITAVITKTTSDVRVVEPLAVLGMAYLAYLTAELFHFSGIICIIFCGLLQAHYSFKNISTKSYVTVKYFIKMVSSTSEAIIFLFLGIVLLSYHHDFSSGFIYWSLLLCFIIRFIGVFALTTIANMFRVKRIQLQEQLITAYGGLRGAVGFSLVIMLADTEVKAKSVYVTTTLVVILFTVFIQGSTIKPLVKLLQIEISGDKNKSLIGEIQDQVASHLMAGIEEIVGYRGNFYLKRKVLDLDEKYLHKIFLKDWRSNRIRQVFEKASLNHHYAHLYGPVTLIEDHKSEMLRSGKPSAQPPSMRQIPFVTDELAMAPSQGSFSEIFSGVELRRKSGSEIKPKLLRKAFQSNPFQKYFQRYQPTLMDDYDHELAAQLELRRQRANRITQAVIEPYRASMRQDIDEDSDEGIGNLGRRLSIRAKQEQSQQETVVAIESIMKRAHRRRTIAHMGTYSAYAGTEAKETTSGIEMQPMKEPSSPQSTSAHTHAPEEEHLLNAKKNNDSDSNP